MTAPARDTEATDTATASHDGATKSPAETVAALRASIGSVLLGKPEVVDGALLALLGGGHLLIEDVPGVGKTLLARAIARSIDADYNRVQFTPDLLPGDILGTSVYHQQDNTFHFQKGPIFSNVLLADEINRSSPRTQSALLEAMNDRQVSFDKVTHPLPDPFLVLATQNPFEFEGTYPLPESQMDRFMTRLAIGYPARAAERNILRDHREGEPVESLAPAVSLADVVALQAAVRRVRCEPAIEDYLLDLVHATREHPDLHVGVSTRGALMLYRAAQGSALMDGRDYLVPDDVQRLAVPVLAHRIVTKGGTEQWGRETAERAVQAVLSDLTVPT